MNIPKEQEELLAKLSTTARTPEEYNAMLRSLPDAVKRTFADLDSATVREYSVRNVKRRMAEFPELAKLLDRVAVLNIVDQIYNNIIEDQKLVRTYIEQDAQKNAQKNVSSGQIRVLNR